MSSTPSRSEIETALSGRTKRHKAKTKRPPQPSFDLEVPPRRQQVIGGDLTGVNSRPKRGIFSRYSDISLSFWFAGAVVLLILLAFFWPQSGDSTREVTEALAKTQSEMISSVEPVEESANQTSEVGSFTRDSDLVRANDFRERDEKNIAIGELLKKAETLVAKGQYTQPASNSAASTYKAILAIEPKNVAARQGLSAIKDRFLDAGVQALDQDNETIAQSALERLSLVDATSEEYEELELAIESWQTGEKLDDLLSKASTAIAQDRLILPADSNALFYYREALKVDEDNSAAKKGIQKVASTYIERANTAVLNGEYQTAAAHLATVSVIDPNHSSISLIEEMMTKAKPIAEQAQATDEKPELSETEQAPLVANIDPSPNTSAVPSEPELAKPAPSRTKPSTERTPTRQSTEQADFDRQYLKRGLEAYYKGQYETAAALLQPLADKGVARAQFRLAYMHYLGRGFKRDRQEADRRIRAALPAIRKFADQGRAWAQSDIGSLYEDGLVLPRDFGEAVYWYRSAAEQGYPGAQTNLGLMYARGRGVSSSRRTAILWFQRAAKQGDDVAKRNLKALGVN